MKTEKNSKKEKNNWLERLITIIASVLVIFTFVFLVYHLIYDNKIPADIVVDFEDIVENSNGFSVQIFAENKGNQTAKNVTIEIILTKDSLVEKSQLNFQYIPGESEVQGWVNFKTKPQIQNLESHVLGFTVP